MSKSKKLRHSVRQLLGTPAIGGITAALLFQPVIAQEASRASQSAAGGTERSSILTEVIVTASRREQNVTELPYNVTALGSEQVQRTGISNIEDLSRQIPNLVVTSSGSQYLGAQRQIMRGLNASVSDRSGVALEQNPVSTYLGNAPYANFFQIDDIQRVEVLRGPQGTLYGAGTLGGAIRLIPSAPELGSFEGKIDVTTATVAHSSDLDYSSHGVINVPLGDSLSVRAVAGYKESAGFIDQFSTWVRPGNNPLAPPVLVDNNAPLTSPAQSTTVKDVNSSESTDWRVALRWKPSEQFEATLAYNDSHAEGFGPNSDTPSYNGGTDPLIPSVVYPDTGEYEVVQRALQPFNRDSDMATLDLSLDLGFATLSTTSSFFETSGETTHDGTWGTLALPAAYLPYYTGTPANPRFNSIQRFDDRNDVDTHEIRLVSNSKQRFDYVVGLFYQKEENYSEWSGFAPGQTAYNALPGVTVPGLGPGAGDRLWLNSGTNEFTDKALFGELTWHATDALDLSIGARTFKQTLDRTVENVNPAFGITESGSNSAEFSDNKFRFNATYEYFTDHRVYFTFSQGFRRGGANAFSLTGFLREPVSLLDYKPDSVDNYELGVKGNFENGWRYTADVFLGKWHDPQIGGFTPVNFWAAVFNGKEAETKGVELELSGRLADSLRLSFGYSYTEAELTEDFCIAAANGTGDPAQDIPCAIRGLAGTPLPSAPEHSGTATLDYEFALSNDDVVTATLNANYKSSTRQNLPTNGARYPLIPDYWLLNAYVGWIHGPITTSLYARNVLDERVVYSTNTRITPYAPIDAYDRIGRPRTVGVELTYRW